MQDTKLNNTAYLDPAFIENLLKNIDPFTTSKILELTLNALMKAERSLHLNSNQTDKANGYYQRSLGTPLGVLGLSVPRDRDGDFRPHILPNKYVRDIEERFNTLKALFTQSYSPSAINAIFEKLGLSYSKKELDQLKQLYLHEYEAWAKRDLPHDSIGIFIDAYLSDALLDGKVKKISTFIVLGYNFNGFKDLFALEINPGNESKDYWLSVFNRLIDRGLKCPLFVISDDFPGITEAVATLFPKAKHQLCLLHLMRNLRKNMAKTDASSLINKLNTLKNYSDPDSALNDFLSSLHPLKDKYPAYIKYLKNKIHSYFQFLYLPQDTRKYFYSTNPVESFNSILEKKRNNSGGFFQSIDYLKINIYLHYTSLKTQKWNKPTPALKANLYLISQLFAQSYDRLPDSQTQFT